MKKIIFFIVTCLVFTFTVSAQDTAKMDSNDSAEVTKKKKRVIFRATKVQIVEVQTMLKNKGSYKGDLSGKFNKDFRKSIKGFQGDNGLKKTGTLNRATLEKMGVELTEKQKAIPVNPNSFAGSKEQKKKPRRRAFRPTKSQIKTAQTKLKDAGKFKGDVTGKYSDDFRTVLKNYQVENALAKTGKLDKATLVKMEIVLTDKQNGKEATAGKAKKRRRSFRVNKTQITKAQIILKDKKLFVGEISGKYSKDLRAAIRDFQSANGLKRKGSLNRVTLVKLGIELTDKQKEIPVNPNDIAKPKDPDAPKKKRKIFRANKEQIMQVQAMLREKGLYEGEDTGKLNPATRSAIREWQTQNNIKKTGTLNKETLEAMKIELTDKQKDF